MRRLGLTLGLLALLGGVAYAATVPPAVTALTIAPAQATLAPRGEQRFRLAIDTAWPNPLRDPQVRWSVSPSSLGTVDADGRFRAAPVSGAGTVTVVAGSVAASAAVSVRCPRSLDQGGFSFTPDCLGPADVYFESGFAAADTQMVLRSLQADIARVESDYGRHFARRPLVYAFRTDASFRAGLVSVLTSGGKLPRIATEADGIFLPDPEVVAVNWAEASKQVPLTTLRHELTHMMIGEIVGTHDAAVPAWLNEGSARLEELTIANTAWLAARERYYAASMAATGTLFAIDDLSDLATWDRRTGLAADYQYHAASAAATFLRDDVGQDGLVRILVALGEGRSFNAAYAAVALRPFSEFATAYANRVRGLASAYPGLGTATDTPRGPGLMLILYGFAPSTEVTVTLSAGRETGRSTTMASPYGAGAIVVGSDFPPGTYTISAAGANGRVTVTARKP